MRLDQRFEFEFAVDPAPHAEGVPTPLRGVAQGEGARQKRR